MVRSDRHTRRNAWAAVAAVAVVFACSSSELTISCAPTPTCSLRAERLAPPPVPDAGPSICDEENCRAGSVAAGGRHTCGVAVAGELFCWGDDSEGMRGDAPFDGGVRIDGGTVLDADVALDAGPLELRVNEVFGVGAVREVTTGTAHSCALLVNDEVHCWGRNAEGQVDGAATPEPRDEPRQVPAASGARAVAAGGSHSCAIVGGAVVCWGSARFGQSGRAVMDAALEPGVVDGTTGAVQVAAGIRHSCVLLEDGRIRCWGELVGDDGATTTSATPVEVAGIDDAVEIAAGAGHTCAIRSGGEVWCWGENGSGQLGDGTMRSRAAPAMVRSDAVTLSAGGIELDGALVGHSCFINRAFHVECWGRNREGQLGDATDVDSAVPVEVLENKDAEEYEPLEDVITVSCGGLHTCALDESGDVFCWGDDTHDQLGIRRRPAPLARAREAAQFR